MARYCFYCGKELEDNEKCYCQARTRAEAAARSAVYGQSQENTQDQTNRSNSTESSGAKQSAATASGSYSSTYSTFSSETQGKPSDTKSKRESAKKKRAAAKEKRRAERERLRQVRAEAKRRAQAEKERRRQSYQSNAAGSHNPYQQKSNSYGAQQARGFGRELLQLLTRPADAIKAQAVPFWSTSHTIYLIASSLLGGAHISFANRWLYSVLFSDRLVPPNLEGAGLYFTGVLISAFFLFLYTGTLWLLARFIFRQGGLPFSHTLAVGKTAWAYLTLFMLIALPTTMQGGFFGLLLVLMGFAFSCLVHARSVAVITHLSDNQAINLTLVSLLIFTSLFAAAIAFFQTILIA